ncbi:MAG: hypothetical protein JO256_07390 [Alphaproteobacteria bacterium]|nr:hypothetical protein [Alphaproteobacteria bacterium]
MDIHKPKPFHNWREFLKEYAIIVLGVATALAAEQAVEWWHWRGQVALAREQIADELAWNLSGAIERMRSGSCVEQRLDALALVLDGAAKSGTLPPVGDIGLPKQQSMLDGVWESIVTSQTAPHFPSAQLQSLAATYKLVQTMETVKRQEMEEWKNLYAIVGPGRRLDPGFEITLRQALGRARASNHEVVNISYNLIHVAQGVELPFSRAALARLTESRQRVLTGSKPSLAMPNGFSVCDPIGRVPASYGQAPFSAVPSLTDEAIKTIPDYAAAKR